MGAITNSKHLIKCARSTNCGIGRDSSLTLVLCFSFSATRICRLLFCLYIWHMRRFFTMLLLLVFTMMLNSANAQEKTPLYKAILHMDSVMFDAFNTHNLEVIKTVFAPNAEFYHDRGGLGDYQTTMANFRTVFEKNPDLKRELLLETLEVYPIPEYGAIEIGTHRFTVSQDGRKITSLYKFIHTWQYKDGQWKVTRAISVGH
jgi:hypothetical protein